ncbi:uncharacterized protein LOC113344459 [Papaver somniferum]|uniref:uncharacterized protein LOC113344459 n=1 Tax=Papaver somniferum TaxID=3469 RepID=UPI000E6F7754|nr:uncharacterized protein LOC113344459 [Papaver somniferum]XP_026444214.1 uncharacterized protein LOC113344459 [Papaver somniferum]
MDKTKDCAPSTDLISKYLPLYKAAKEGDWKKAKNFIDNNDKDGKDTAVTARITVSNDTALHIAAAEGHSDFVEELVKLMTSEQLELKNFDNETALQLAAVAGNIISIKAMVGKNPALVNMRDRYGCIPLLNVTNCAPSNDQKKDMIQYLYRVMIEHPGKPSLFSGDLGRQIICSIIGDGFFDIAHHMIDKYPKLTIEQDPKGKGPCALEMMVTSDAFLSRNQLTFWDRFISSLYFASSPGTLLNGDVENPPEETSRDNTSTRVSAWQWMRKVIWKVAKHTTKGHKLLKEKVMHEEAVKLMKFIIKIMKNSLKEPPEIIEFFKATNILFTAIDFGAAELVKECLQAFPCVTWVEDSQGRGIFYHAVKVRHEKIFKLLYGITGFKNKFAASVDIYDNTILHMAAWPVLASPFERPVSCIVLRLQRELQWFKEVESLVPPAHRIRRNDADRTAQDLFEYEHRELFSQGEKWIKDISQSCSFVTALIATVVFTATFTAPGGYNNSGVPIFLHENSFIVFAVANAMALFSSTLSLLTFLALLTSEYQHDDFLKAIPKKLVLGLVTLFISVIAMMVAFSATLCIVLGPRYTWLPIPVMLVAPIPVGLFLWSYVPLFCNMVYCAFGHSIFH